MKSFWINVLSLLSGFTFVINIKAVANGGARGAAAPKNKLEDFFLTFSVFGVHSLNFTMISLPLQLFSNCFTRLDETTNKRKAIQRQKVAIVPYFLGVIFKFSDSHILD